MPIQVIIAAIAIAGSLPLLVYGVAGAGGTLSLRGKRKAAPVADMYQISLERSAADRLFRPLVGGLAGRLRRLTPRGWIRSLERKVQLAGMPPGKAERVLAVKMVVAVAGVLATLWAMVAMGTTPGLLVGILALGGYVAPDLSLGSRARERQQRIQIELPDVLDQIMISVEAGLAFEAALARAGKTGTGPLAAEIMRAMQEIQMGVPRRTALNSMASRTDVPDLRNFVFAVVQSERYGLPIAHTLRVQAAELRDKRRQRAEERAFKIPVKIVFPLIFCIFPSLFIVLLGPAGIRMWRALFA